MQISKTVSGAPFVRSLSSLNVDIRLRSESKTSSCLRGNFLFKTS